MELYHTLIERLRSQHEALPEIIAGVDGEKFHKQPQENKWSIHDNIAHLASYQPIFKARIDKILSENGVSFDRYKADDDPEFENYRKRATDDLLKQIQSDRQEIFDLILGVSESERNKIGIHPKYGKLNIVMWTEFFLLHEAHHLFTIFQLTNNT